MKNTENDELINILNELKNTNCNDNLLREILFSFKKEWDIFLKPSCILLKKSYYKMIVDILINSGFEVEDRKKFENKIKVYLNRMN